MSEIPDCDCYCFEKVEALRADLERRLQESEAGAAALRKTLQCVHDNALIHSSEFAHVTAMAAGDALRSSDSGREMLARLEESEAVTLVLPTRIRATALEDAARAAEEEERLYAESVREQDAQGSYEIGTAESRAVMACRSVAAAIRALGDKL